MFRLLISERKKWYIGVEPNIHVKIGRFYGEPRSLVPFSEYSSSDIIKLIFFSQMYNLIFVLQCRLINESRMKEKQGEHGEHRYYWRGIFSWFYLWGQCSWKLWPSRDICWIIIRSDIRAHIENWSFGITVFNSNNKYRKKIGPAVEINSIFIQFLDIILRHQRIWNSSISTTKYLCTMSPSTNAQCDIHCVISWSCSEKKHSCFTSCLLYRKKKRKQDVKA